MTEIQTTQIRTMPKTGHEQVRFSYGSDFERLGPVLFVQISSVGFGTEHFKNKTYLRTNGIKKTSENRTKPV